MLRLINPWVVLAAVLALFATLGGGYQWGASAARDSMLAQQARDQQTIELVRRAVAEQIAGMEVRNVTIRQEVQREIVEKPVYRDCVHDPRIMQLINAALTGAEPASGGELPGANPAR